MKLCMRKGEIIIEMLISTCLYREEEDEDKDEDKMEILKQQQPVFVLGCAAEKNP